MSNNSMKMWLSVRQVTYRIEFSVLIQCIFTWGRSTKMLTLKTADLRVLLLLLIFDIASLI